METKTYESRTDRHLERHAERLATERDAAHTEAMRLSDENSRLRQVPSLERAAQERHEWDIKTIAALYGALSRAIAGSLTEEDWTAIEQAEATLIIAEKEPCPRIQRPVAKVDVDADTVGIP